METLPRPFPPKFITVLDDVLKEEEKQRGPSKDFRHHPSSASNVLEAGSKWSDKGESVTGACLRNIFYRATNQPETNPKKMSTKLQAGFGDAIHGWLLSKLQKSKKLTIQSESAGKVTVEPLTNIVSFRLDGLVTYQGDMGGLEIKTSQNFGLARMLKKGGPRPYDILQVMTYFATNPLIRWFALVYVCRDTGFWVEYHMWRDPKTGKFMLEGIYPEKQPESIEGLTFEGVVDRWKAVEAYVANKELPPRDYQAVLNKDGEVTDKRTKNGVDYETDFRCKYCEFQTHCWSLPDALEKSKKVGV